MNTSIYRFASLLAFAGVALSASAQVNNPGFETGTFTGSWTLVNNSGTTDTFVGNLAANGFTPHSGTFVAGFGAIGGTDTLSQSIATTAGQRYSVSFYLRSNTGDTNVNDSFVASFGGGSLSFGNLPATYSLYTFTGIATSTSTTLSFTGRDDPSFYLLDDVSVVAAPVPEPASFAALGLGVVAVLRRRRRA